MIENNLIEIVENQDIEIKLLLEGIYLKYGYDFRNYSKAHLKRRIMHRLSISKVASITELLYKALYEKDFIKILLSDFSINVTEMFRDPEFYFAFRKNVVPVLKTYPFIRIWHAGCSTGEEVYSMAILLKEEGLYDRVQIYATDFNNAVLQKAKEGIYPAENLKDYEFNYSHAGGKASLSDYYVSKYDSIIFKDSLKEKITFAEHNLVTDGSFGEMHVVICRNVMIYFNKELQNRVFNLFSNTLCSGCFLCLGSKESIKFSSEAESFEEFLVNEKIYRKKYIK